MQFSPRPLSLIFLPLLLGPTSQARAQVSSVLDMPMAVFRWQKLPSHEEPLLELQLHSADEILLTEIAPHPPFMVVERACGRADMYYSAAERTIVLCREMAAFATSLSKEVETRAASSTAAVGGTMYPSDSGFLIFSVLHETGHALIRQMSIPNLGGGEDAADGFAAWMLLHKGVPRQRKWYGDDSTRNSLVLMDAASLFDALQSRANATSAGKRTEDDYTNSHPMPAQRTERLWCYLMGRYPRFRRSVDDDARLGNCVVAWTDLDSSWRRLLVQASRRRVSPAGAQ